MDLGIYTEADTHTWKWTLQVLAAIDEQSAALRPFQIEPGSRVDELSQVFPDPPVDLRTSVIRGLDTSLDCTQQLRRYVTGKAYTTPILIGTMMRSLLLSSSRVVFLLGPSDPDVRRQHALGILAQESASLKRHFRIARDLKVMKGLQPPADILSGQTQAIENVLATTKQLTESAMLEQAIAVEDELLRNSEFATEVTDDLLGALKESVSLAFQNYSGLAHGYAWPCATPGTNSYLPLQFHTDLLMFASICQMGLRLFSEQSHTDKRNLQAIG